MAINPLNYLGFMILGGALLWAVRLVYSDRPGTHDDWLKRLFLLAGWILLVSGSMGIIIGMTGPLSLLPLIGLLLMLLAYWKYMAAERRSLLWALAIAAERGIPLEQAARAFATERAVQNGLRTARLADLLEAGAPLPNALTLARQPLPTDTLLAARLGAETGDMAAALRMAIDHDSRLESIVRTLLARLFYIAGVAFIGLTVTSFILVKIVPVYATILGDFGVVIPVITQLNIDAANAFVRFWPLTLPLYALFIFWFLLGLSYYLGGSRYELPLFHQFWRRCDGALVMRSLALTVTQQRNLHATIFMLSKQYPKKSVGDRLARASRQIDNGVAWSEALCGVGLISHADAAVLQAAERVGNLPWALDEMADSALRRFALRLRMMLNIAFPLVVLSFGAVVLLITVGMFLPLVSLIEGMI
jgi:type II secretory pathway component PulF